MQNKLKPGSLCKIHGYANIYIVTRISGKYCYVKQYTGIPWRKNAEKVSLSNVSIYIPTALTLETAPTTRSIYNTVAPEWGIKKFEFDPIHSHHSQGEAVLFEREFHQWAIVEQY